MNIEQSVAYLGTLKGEANFERRPSQELAIAFSDLTLIMDSLGIILPQKFSNIYARLWLQNPKAYHFQQPQDLTSYWAFRSSDGTKMVLFEGFMSANDIISEAQPQNEVDAELHDLGLLKIGRIPWQGGIYVGVKEHNCERIYWAKWDNIDPDILDKNLSECEGLILLANDSKEFLAGLFVHLPEYDGFEIAF